MLPITTYFKKDVFSSSPNNTAPKRKRKGESNVSAAKKAKETANMKTKGKKIIGKTKKNEQVIDLTADSQVDVMTTTPARTMASLSLTTPPPTSQRNVEDTPLAARHSAIMSTSSSPECVSARSNSVIPSSQASENEVSYCPPIQPSPPDTDEIVPSSQSQGQFDLLALSPGEIKSRLNILDEEDFTDSIPSSQSQSDITMSQYFEGLVRSEGGWSSAFDHKEPITPPATSTKEPSSQSAPRFLSDTQDSATQQDSQTEYDLYVQEQSRLRKEELARLAAKRAPKIVQDFYDMFDDADGSYPPDFPESLRI